MTRNQFKQEKRLVRNKGVGGIVFAKVGLIRTFIIAFALFIILIVFSFQHW